MNSPQTISLSSTQWERLELFLTSEPGWDGGSAKGAPDQKTVAEALQVIEYLRQHGINHPLLFMGSCGEIEIAHISKGSTSYLNIEVQGDGSFMIGHFVGDIEQAYFVKALSEIRPEFIRAMRNVEETEYGTPIKTEGTNPE